MDTILSTLLQFKLLKLHWRDISQCAVESLPIVLNFDEFKQAAAPIFFVDENIISHHFPFQYGKKGFGHSVIPAVPFPTHALNNTIEPHYLCKPTTTVLYASVGMKYGASHRTTFSNRAIEGGEDRIMFQRMTYAPTDDTTGKQINEDCQIQP